MKESCELLVINSHDFPTGAQYKLHMASPTAQGLLNHMTQALGLLSPQPTHVIGSFPHWGSSQSQLPFTSSIFLAENSFLWNMLLSEFKLVLQVVCLSLWLRTERWKHFSLTLERMTPFIPDHQIPSNFSDEACPLIVLELISHSMEFRCLTEASHITTSCSSSLVYYH